MECYDFESERWLVMTEKPGHVFGSAMCSVKGRLYTLGGVQSKQVDQYTVQYSTVQYSTVQVDQYDPETDSWLPFFPSLRHCRVAHGVVALEDSIYVAGGSAKVLSVWRSSSSVFSSSTGNWQCPT